MTIITGAILAALTIATYIKRKPDRCSNCFKTLSTAVGLAALSMAMPIRGWLLIGAVACQLLSAVCVLAAGRIYRLQIADNQHHEECQVMGYEMEWKH